MRTAPSSTLPFVLLATGVLACGCAPATSTDNSLPTLDETSSGGAVGGTHRAALDPPRSEISNAEMPDPDSEYLNWPKPEFVFFLTGQQHGFIEPCGCTGLDNQKGGMARRHTLARQLADRGWPIVAIDAGNQVRRFGPQAEIKFQVSVDGLRTIGYQAIALGSDDLRLSIDGLVATTTDDQGGQGTPFVCANAAVLDPSLTPTHQIVQIAGRKIGITAVIGDQWLAEIKSDEIVDKPASEALSDVLPKLKEADCDVHLLIAHATMEESKSLANQFPDFEIVVTAGGEGDPTYQPERIGAHGAMLVRVGIKGMHVGLVGVFAERQTRFRYQRIPLTSNFEDSPEMLGLLASYQSLLEEEGLARLGARPLPHSTGRQFVGSLACGECHTEAYDKWLETPHADATDSLVHPGERTDIPRHFDPECLSCHVTGWNPQRYFPYASGYMGLEESPLLHGNGCENCHGPGSAHVAAERGDEDVTEEVRVARMEAMRLPLAKAEQDCMKCHDLDNSPDFHDQGAFQKYWKEIEHYGLD